MAKPHSSNEPPADKLEPATDEAELLAGGELVVDEYWVPPTRKQLWLLLGAGVAYAAWLVFMLVLALRK